LWYHQPSFTSSLPNRILNITAGSYVPAVGDSEIVRRGRRKIAKETPRRQSNGEATKVKGVLGADAKYREVLYARDRVEAWLSSRWKDIFAGPIYV
jgi:hypothetical protein